MIGQTLGHYRVDEHLGSGAMGHVYRAFDTRLRREVAIKVLPEAFANDPERLQRFEREAYLLASLNHPNIAAIYGLEESEGVHYLVLELVPGRTLAQRLLGGALPLDRALAICGQIAEALEAAHEKGIVHRDLKPANIKVTPDGKVKVLDFGIAKVFHQAEAAHADQATLAPSGTRESTILGTGPYMSPEQARGETVGKRTDIWAFGCVLYEALAGRPAFAGETLFDTVAAVLKHEPDWHALPESTPPAILVLLRRCLSKDIRRRLRDIGDAGIELDDAVGALKSPQARALGIPPTAPVAAPVPAPKPAPSSAPPVPVTEKPAKPPRRRAALWVSGIAAAALLSGLAVWWISGGARRSGSVSGSVSAPDQSAPAAVERQPAAVPFSGHSDEVFAIAYSPDGTQLASASGDKTVKIWETSSGRGLRSLAGQTGKVFAVCFSPDGRWLAAGGEDRMVRLWQKDQGGVRVLPGNVGVISAAAFSPDGRLLAIAGSGLAVSLWEAGTWHETRRLKGHTDWIRAVAFSPDGTRLASAGDDKTVKVWDVGAASELYTLSGSAAGPGASSAGARGISSLAFSPDGKWLASGTWKMAYLWDAASGKWHRAFAGHDGWVLALAFSRDGSRLVTGGADSLAKTWDVAAGNALLTLKGHSRGVSSLAFSPDGRWLASGSWDKTLRIWEAAGGKEVRTLAAVSP